MNYFIHSLLIISHTNVWELFLFWHMLLLLNKINRFKIRFHRYWKVPQLPTFVWVLIMIFLINLIFFIVLITLLYNFSPCELFYSFIVTYFSHKCVGIIFILAHAIVVKFNIWYDIFDKFNIWYDIFDKFNIFHSFDNSFMSCYVQFLTVWIILFIHCYLFLTQMCGNYFYFGTCYCC